MPKKENAANRPGRRAAQQPPDAQPRVPVIGLEAEFSLFVQDEKRKPEHVFRNPQEIVREKMIPRTGRSFHLPSGGALYFDTGVIEVATPIIELEPGCCARGVRSLWEQIAFVREELNHWEARSGSATRLEGFSAHYNISVNSGAPLDPMARLLTYLLAAPVMLLAANRLSTGIGVRPREQRVEITADFTPDPSLMTAAATLIVAMVTEVAAWASHDLGELETRKIPVIEGFAPRPHTSRKGYLARFDCYPENPFTTDPNRAAWKLRTGRVVSLRQMALAIARPFRRAMRRLSDADTVEHIFAVLGGKARSLLDFDERPHRYEDVGRAIDWDRRHRTIERLPRSKYERVIQRIITHKPIRVDGTSYRPERMRGWYEVIFRNEHSGRRRVFNLDDLVRHCAV